MSARVEVKCCDWSVSRDDKDNITITTGDGVHVLVVPRGVWEPAARVLAFDVAAEQKAAKQREADAIREALIKPQTKRKRFA